MDLIPRLTAWLQLNKAKIFLGLVGALLLVMLWNGYQDQKAALARQQAELSILSENFRKIGDAVVAQGALAKNDRDAFTQALALQGKTLTDAMKAQDAKVQALFEAQGRVIAELVRNRGTDGPVDWGKDGAFSGARMIQGRTSGPSLTDVTVRYDPKNPDPSKRILGDWSNYREDFFPSVIEWQKADGGFAGTFRLRREVYRPDGTKVGEEEIPVTAAQATFNPRTLPGGSILVPHWGVTVGGAWDWRTKSWGPLLLGDYRITNHVGISGGWAGNQALIGTSIRFGAP